MPKWRSSWRKAGRCRSHTTRTRHAQVRWAVKHRIPTVLLIRPAEDAIVSHVIRDPYLPLGQALSDWILFYQALLPWRDQMVIADFGKVTNGFGEVVQRLNRDYGTRFAIFENSEENIARCYQAIEELFRKRWHRAQVDEVRVPRPSASRSPLKELSRRSFLPRNCRVPPPGSRPVQGIPRCTFSCLVGWGPRYAGRGPLERVSGEVPDAGRGKW